MEAHEPRQIWSTALQMACLQHFQSEPLSVLVPAAASGPEALAQACGALPQALRSGIEGSTARQSLGKVMAAWAAWAVSLRWMHAAAQALGRGHSAGAHPFRAHIHALLPRDCMMCP